MDEELRYPNHRVITLTSAAVMIPVLSFIIVPLALTDLIIWITYMHLIYIKKCYGKYKNLEG